MNGTLVNGSPPSLLGITIRRAATSGRFFLVYGTVMATLLSIALAATGGAAFSSAIPLLLPIFGVVGSMGGLMVFTNDRLKGVLEYLMAYGIPPRRLFLDVLETSLLLLTIVLGIALGAGVSFYLARGHPLPGNFVVFVCAYTLPMSYVSSAFAATAGMFWTTLSSPREGMNSPIGLIPLIGVLPPVATLMIVVLVGATGTVTPSGFFEVAAAMMTGVAVFVVVLLSLTGRLLRRERLLSPA
ncbi:MAG TPA: hypothetical protein VEH28_01950 [Thermoplasmata archaeon]|nr:hypothetical protein [Thermoplasmata archaeon]